MKRSDITTKAWEDYELIDSGEGRKLERFGTYILDRPDPQAIWSKSFPQKWVQAHGRFARGKDEKWSIADGVMHEWVISYKGASFNLSFGSFKHIGIFPEHALQWEDIAQLCDMKPGTRVLNLFGYTGGASLIAALHGAQVTHVDASKQTMQTVKDNIKISKLPQDCMRLVVEDALKYAKRLVSRGEVFDIIIMDPPAFGRGPKGEVWKINEKLPELALLIPQLLSPQAQKVIINGYAAGFSARSFGELIEGCIKNGTISYGDVGIMESDSERILPTGIYAAWQPK